MSYFSHADLDPKYGLRSCRGNILRIQAIRSAPRPRSRTCIHLTIRRDARDTMAAVVAATDAAAPTPSSVEQPSAPLLFAAPVALFNANEQEDIYQVRDPTDPTRRHAIPRHAMPCRAMPCRAMLMQCLPTTPRPLFERRRGSVKGGRRSCTLVHLSVHRR